MTALRPQRLRCEYLVDPIGLHEPRPRLFWTLDGGAPGAVQSAYEIHAGTAPGSDDLWSSGKVSSSAAAHIRYEGRPLGTGERAWWTVRV